MSRLVLSLCDYAGVMVEPWIEAGYEALIVDLQHQGGANITKTKNGLSVSSYGGDVRNFIPPLATYAAVFAFPPCTNLAVSGARWFQEKGLSSLCESLSIVEWCRRICEWSGAPWMLENPVSTISTYWRKPDFSFNPCDYAGYLQDPSGEAYTKKTCLWTGGGFRMPAPKPVEPTLGSMMHKLPPSENRGDLRSITPQGFARGVFHSNNQVDNHEGD
mgnify:CR=1 FL=1